MNSSLHDIQSDIQKLATQQNQIQQQNLIAHQQRQIQQLQQQHHYVTQQSYNPQMYQGL